MGSADRPTVLVVEDEPQLAEVYARWLERRYDVRTAGSGSEALEAFDDEVDVVLLDRLMPGMSGDEVVEEIRERGSDCRVAMVTAVEPDFDIITLGFDDYLTKPVEQEDLLGAVERLLDRASFADLELEFYSLAAKRAALKSAKTAGELDGNEEYADLEARIEELESELDETMPDVGRGEFVAMVRDIEDDPAEGADGRDGDAREGRDGL